MNGLRKILLASVAAAVLWAPMAHAQPRPHYDGPRHHHVEKKRPSVQKRQTRHFWKRGERVADWKGRAAVRDYHRHGLRKPPRDQHWIRIGNDYLLIRISNGMVTGIVAGR